MSYNEVSMKNTSKKTLVINIVNKEDNQTSSIKLLPNERLLAYICTHHIMLVEVE